jgi:hypothetical protein
MSRMDVIAVLWGSCVLSAKLVAVDVLLLKWVRCVYNSIPGFGLQFLSVKLRSGSNYVIVCVDVLQFLGLSLHLYIRSTIIFISWV